MTTPDHPTLLYSGFDTLHVAYQGALEYQALDILKRAKEDAKNAQDKQLITIGPGDFECHIDEIGARNGYAFRLSTGPTGIGWLVKHNGDVRQWNLFASFFSATLLEHGYYGAKALAKSNLNAMGAKIIGESINRVDFAMDFRMDGFRLNPERFVGHNRSTVQRHYSPIENTHTDPTCPTVITKGRKVTGVTIGKMPGQQLIVYDKRRDAIDKNKFYWFDVWGLDPKDVSIDIFRVEVRAGKRLLKDCYCLTKFSDLENSIGDVFYRAVQQIRYVEPRLSDKNISRAPPHQLWELATSEVLRSMDNMLSGLLPGQFVNTIREEKVATYLMLTISNAIGYAVALGKDDKQIKDGLPNIIRDQLAKQLKRDEERFFEKVAKTRNKLRFIG